MSVRRSPLIVFSLWGAPCLPIALALLATISLATSCASPGHDAQAAQDSQLQPWTPQRRGVHPGQLKHSQEARHDADSDRSQTGADRGESILQNPIGATAYGAWRLYSNTLSRSMGPTCRFSPTCSRFAVDATGVGPEGLVFTFGRLQRNHLADDDYEHGDDGHLLDPPSNYFFWRSDLGLGAHRSSLPDHQAWYIFVRARQDRAEEPHDTH